MLFGFTGCSGSESAGKTYSSSASVNDIMKAAESENTAKSETVAESEKTSGAEAAQSAASSKTSGKTEIASSQKTGYDKMDVDLTELSSTLVYSGLYTIMSEPDKYNGKTIKMKGKYTFYHDDSVGKDYTACIVQDATACCALGLDFVLTDDYSFPKDYPKENEEITVMGVFELYPEGDRTFFHLSDAVLA